MRGERPATATSVGGWWVEDRSAIGCKGIKAEHMRRYHRHEPRENHCSSTVIKHIKAPLHLVWSLVRRFDQPQKYKPFVRRCVVQGDLEIGRVCKVNIMTGLPATTSRERLKLLDDKEHILGIKIVGGDHRLKDGLDEESFENHRSGLIAEKLEKDPSLSYETGHYWTQIVDKSIKGHLNYCAAIFHSQHRHRGR